MVQVNARAIEGAPSAATLGKIRRGSGVVIGPDDLILTIAYLVTETEQLNIRTQDQKPTRPVWWLRTAPPAWRCCGRFTR